MIQVSAGWAPIVQIGFVALIGLGMVLILFNGLRRFYRKPAPPAPLARWSPQMLGDLAFDGTRVTTTSPFKRSTQHELVSAQRIADLVEAEERGRPLPSGGLLRPVARLALRKKAIGPFVRSATVTLETTGPVAVLDLAPHWEWPWNVAALPSRMAITVDGRALGGFEIGDGSVLARDTAGSIAGEWRTGTRPGSWLRTPEAARGEDRPTYAPLRLASGMEAELRLPLGRLAGRRLDFSGVGFLKDLPDTVRRDDEPWLLAFVALSAAASANLLMRDRPRSSRPHG